jgi:hypothetical protein
MFVVNDLDYEAAVDAWIQDYEDRIIEELEDRE